MAKKEVTMRIGKQRGIRKCGNGKGGMSESTRLG